LNYYENLFNNLIKAGESLGIVWKNIELVSFLYKADTPISGSELHLLNGHINFRSENKNYFLYGIDAQEYKYGYKVSFIRNIKQGVLTKYINSINFPEPEF
jgi:predicted helicase